MTLTRGGILFCIIACCPLPAGSLLIQCCSDLPQLTALSALARVTGTVRVHYNQRIYNIDGFTALTSVGNLEISQNGNLTEIGGFRSLEVIEGRLLIDRNRRLQKLSGLSGVQEIRGSSTTNCLVAGQALSILHNPALPDLSWLGNLTQIGFGTVRIEGNTALCYAGYPQWAVGDFSARPPSGDKGIDWRTLLGVGVPTWQYSWGDEGGGYPTLVVQNNAAYDECGKGLCRDIVYFHYVIYV